MPDVVTFLENLACNTRPMTPDEFAAIVTKSGFDTFEQKALMEGDISALSSALGGRTKMMCMVVPAENDEPEGDEEQGEEDDRQPDTSSLAA